MTFMITVMVKPYLFKVAVGAGGGHLIVSKFRHKDRIGEL